MIMYGKSLLSYLYKPFLQFSTFKNNVVLTPLNEGVVFLLSKENYNFQVTSRSFPSVIVSSIK